jgi:hypothetical protein
MWSSGLGRWFVSIFIQSNVNSILHVLTLYIVYIPYMCQPIAFFSGVLQWVVAEKVSRYGQSLTLFCFVDNFFPYFNLFVSIFIQSNVNSNLHVLTLYIVYIPYMCQPYIYTISPLDSDRGGC